MLDQISGWIKQVTNIGLGLIALGVVLQILFGATIPFMPMDVIGSVVALVKALGSEGLVGLVAIWVLWGIYSKQPKFVNIGGDGFSPISYLINTSVITMIN